MQLNKDLDVRAWGSMQRRGQRPSARPFGGTHREENKERLKSKSLKFRASLVKKDVFAQLIIRANTKRRSKIWT